MKKIVLIFCFTMISTITISMDIGEEDASAVQPHDQESEYREADLAGRTLSQQFELSIKNPEAVQLFYELNQSIELDIDLSRADAKNSVAGYFVEYIRDGFFPNVQDAEYKKFLNENDPLHALERLKVVFKDDTEKVRIISFLQNQLEAYNTKIDYLATKAKIISDSKKPSIDLDPVTTGRSKKRVSFALDDGAPTAPAVDTGTTGDRTAPAADREAAAGDTVAPAGDGETAGTRGVVVGKSTIGKDIKAPDTITIQPHTFWKTILNFLGFGDVAQAKEMMREVQALDDVLENTLPAPDSNSAREIVNNVKHAFNNLSPKELVDVFNWMLENNNSVQLLKKSEFIEEFNKVLPADIQLQLDASGNRVQIKK